MRLRLRLLALPLVVVAVSVSGCGGDDAVTREQYLDHAVEFSTAAKTAEQKASIRNLFDCAWPEVSKDDELLTKFMDADTSNPELSAAMSALLQPCVAEQAKDLIEQGAVTTIAPTTAPPAG